MQMQMLKTMACALIFVMMAVLAGTPSTGHTNEPTVEGQIHNPVQEVSTDAEMPRSATVPRHAVKRWAHRLLLRTTSPRRMRRSALIQAWNRAVCAEVGSTLRLKEAIKGAVSRLWPFAGRRFSGDDEAHIEAQCADCGVHQDDGFAVDLTLSRPQCVDCWMETDGLRAYAPLIIAGLCAAVVALIFEPQTGALLAIGATRQPMPQWAKDAAKKHGVKIRRHESGRKTVACAACLNGIAPGDIKAMLEASGYTQKKPHCAPCAQVMLHYTPEPVPEPSEPAPEPTPEPAPQPAEEPTWAPNRKAGKCAVCDAAVKAQKGTIHPASPRGLKVRCAEHTGQALDAPKTPKIADSPVVETAPNGAEPALDALRTLLGTGTDEAAVKRIVDSRMKPLHAAMADSLDEIRNAQKGLEKAALKAVDRRLADLNRPTVLHHGDPAEPLTPPGAVDHHMLPMILRTIGALTAKGAPMNVQFIGPAGTGKTHAAEVVFDRLCALGFFDGLSGLPEQATVFSCNDEMQPSDLMGRMSPRFFDDGSGAGAGSWAFQTGPAIAQFERPGVLVLDEIDTLNPATASALNAMLANGYITDPDGNRRMRHPRCVVIGTANTRGDGANGDYTASHTQTLAFLDRFAGARIEVDFSPAIEEAIASPEICKRIRTMRRVATEQRMRRVVLSYRALAAAQGLLEAGWTAEQAVGQIAHGFGAERAEVWGYGSTPPQVAADVPFVGLGPMSAEDCAEVNATIAADVVAGGAA